MVLPKKHQWVMQSRFRGLRYIIVGGLATLIHLVVAFGYLNFIGSHVWIANGLGFLLAFGVSYSLQSLFVFEKEYSWYRAWCYLRVQLGALLVALTLASLGNEWNHYIKTLLTVVLLPLVTFIIHRLWTFSD